MAIRLYSNDEIEHVAAAGDAVDLAIAAGLAEITHGVTTADVGRVVADCLDASGATPALRGLRDRGGPVFEHVCCVSVNEELLHAPPRGRILRSGDLVSVDVAAAVGGWHADAARTGVVDGASVVSARGRSLAGAARAVIDAGLVVMGPGVAWLEVVGAMERAAEAAGVRLVPGFAGHGVGATLHEPPAAVCTPDAAADFTLRPGMVLTLEPLVTEGAGETITLDDGWTVLAADRAWGCHEERTLAVGRSGVRVLAGGSGI